MAKVGLKQLTPIDAVPFRGGAITKGEKASIPFGGFSWIQNMRGRHPGFEQRKGCRAKHSTADSTNQVKTLYQFSKGKRVERHFFAQMSDGDVLEATDAPPTVTTGAFGSEVHNGAATGQCPASWANVDDLMVYANGADQHQIYAGTANSVKKFMVFKGSAAPPFIPEEGFNYTKQVTDGLTTTVAVLDSLNTIAAYNCLFICTPVPANRFTWTMAAANGTAAVGTLNYRKSNNTWATTSMSDGTEVLTLDVAPATAWAVGATITGASSGKTCIIVAALTSLTYQISTRSGAFTLGEVLSDGTYTADQGAAHPTVATMGYTGSMTWTHPSDEVPHYMYGISGFWYQWVTSVQLDDNVEVSDLTYGSAFQSIVNVWDGVLQYAIEAQFQQDTGDAFETYGSDTIEIDSMTANGKVYFSTPDPIIGFYVDPGETPNTTASTTINEVGYWDGDSWVGIVTNESLTVTDESNGIRNAGYVTWGRTTGTPQKSEFQGTKYHAYWYYFTVDKTLNDNVIISIETMPYFDIEDLGKSQAVCAWKDKAVYSFDMYPQFAYLAKKDNPVVLNGEGSGLLEAGDGRANAILAMRQFHNELIVHQEERGKEGGCTTIFEGKSDAPNTYGKLLLSSKLGIMNSKSAVVVDGCLTSTATEETIKTLEFWISKSGLAVTDGRVCSLVQDDIQNYFDPLETTTCIRRGYEDQHWMGYDSRDNVLRLGLVTGTSATVPNVFPVFDLTDKVFYFDTPAQPFSCMTEVEAASGNASILQYAGGTADGTVYQLNYGDNDVSTAIDAHVIMELGWKGLILYLRQFLLRVKVQAAGNVTVTPYCNQVAQTARNLSMTYVNSSSEEVRRHLEGCNYQDQHISLKLGNSTASQVLYLIDIGLKIFEKIGH